jgi:hypothetical protein
MNDPEEKQLIENYISSYNSFDIDGMIANLHSEIEFCQPFYGQRGHNLLGLSASENPVTIHVMVIFSYYL